MFGFECISETTINIRDPLLERYSQGINIYVRYYGKVIDHVEISDDEQVLTYANIKLIDEIDLNRILEKYNISPTPSKYGYCLCIGASRKNVNEKVEVLCKAILELTKFIEIGDIK